MENGDSYGKFIAALKKKIGSSRQINVELSELFDKPYDWIYRRLKGINPFTLEEAMALSLKYRIPIDRVSGLRKIEREEQAAAAPLPEATPTPIYEAGYSPIFVDSGEYSLLRRYDQILDALADSGNSEIKYFCNSFPMALFFAFDRLSDYYLFRTKYHESYKGEATPLSEIKVPDEIRDLQRDIAHKSQKIGRTVIVLDDSVVSNLVNEIRFFYCAGLLTAAEVEELKKELGLLLRYMRHVAATGSFDEGGEVTMYFTPLNFDASHIFCKADSVEKSIQGPLILDGHHIFETLLQRMESSLRSSVMITNSGELHRAVFFQKQQAFVDSLLADEIKG